MDEPATDFSERDRELMAPAFPVPLAELPPEERMGAFVRPQLRPGTPPPPAPAPAPGPEGERRGRGLLAAEVAIREHRLGQEALVRFGGPA